MATFDTVLLIVQHLLGLHDAEYRLHDQQRRRSGSAVHDGLSGRFTLLDFAEARSIGYVEYRDGGVYVQGQAELEMYDLTAERLSEQALTDADSVALIRDRIEALA